MRRLFVCAAALALVGSHFAAPAAASQPEAAASVRWEVVATDSVATPNRADQIWGYRVLRSARPAQWWIEIGDPDGGSARVPLHYLRVIDQRAQAEIDGAPGRVIISARRTHVITASVLIGMGLVSLPLVPFLWFRRKYRGERDRRRRLQETARLLAESREDERLRIARDLHDGPLQDLQALHMQLGIAVASAQEGEPFSETAARRLRGVIDETHSVIGEVRGIAEALRPPALGPFGLSAALAAHAERFRQRHPGLVVDLDLDVDGKHLPLSMRIDLFRIAQEAMNNAVKHAAPGWIRVAFTLRPDEVDLVVENDGAGFETPPDPDALAASRHFGLLGMRERAEGLAGSLEVRSTPGRGVRIQVRAPIPEAVAEDP